MFSIVACPRCAGQVSIAAGASPTAQVCCPLCDSQYPLSELLAALPPALIILDEPAAAHAAENAPAQPHWPAAADPVGHAASEPEWKEGDEFDMSPLSLGEPLSLGKPESMAESHSFDEPHSLGDPHAHDAAEMLDDADLLEGPHAFGAADPAEEATIAMQAPRFAAPEHAGFQDHEPHDLGEPEEIGFSTAEESPHDMFASAEEEFSETAFADSPPPASPFAEHDQQELPEMDFSAPDEFSAPADEFSTPGEHDFPVSADEFSAPADEFSAPGEHDFSMPGEHDFSASGEDEFSAPGDHEFSAPGEHAFAPSEEGEFGSIEKQNFHSAAPLQEGDFHREAGEDTGEEIGLADESDEFSLPAPVAPAKGKKAAKAVKPAKAKAAKSDKPKRSLVSTLLLMLIVPLLAVSGLAGIYMGILWGLHRDAIGIASMLPSSLVPAEFHKGPMRTLAGGPGMPAANPLGQPPSGLGAMPEEEPAAGQAPASLDGLDDAAPTPTGRKPAGKPAGDEEEMTPEKPNAAPADDEPLAGAKPKPKAADDGFGADPAEKKPAGDLDDPLSDKPLAGKMTANKVPADDALAGDEPAVKSAAGSKPAAAMKDDLGFDEPADKKPKGPADEPAKEDPLAEPAAPPVLPVDAPTYTLADLDQAMMDVQESIATMAEADTLSEADLKKARAQYFRRFYRLGEVATFAEDDVAAPRLAEEKVAIAGLLKKTATDDAKLAQIGKAATKWLAFAKRGEHAGILLAGTVAEVIHEGKLYEITIAIPGVEEPISVFSGIKPKVAEEDRVILLGSVVDNPTANLPGYTGEDPAVVWNGLTIKLPAAAAAAEPAEETK